MSAIEPNDFFKERRSFTEIKQEIVGQYFNTWCSFRLATLAAEAREAMLYIDLYAGKVQHTAQGTALPVNAGENLYKSIFKKPALNKALRSFFYDPDKAVLEQVRDSIQKLPYIDELVHAPLPLNSSDNKAQLAALLEAGCPSLMFLDPFSSRYAQEALLQVVQVWQSDLFMLLCPETILKTLAGKRVSQPLKEVLGVRLEKINNYCRKEKDNYRRQEFILNQFMSVLHEKKHYTLLFKVNPPEVAEPVHYLLFSSPDGQAYRSFKETLLPYTTYQQDGVPQYVANEFKQPQLALFAQPPAHTLQHLVQRLENQAGLYKYKSIEKIYELDSCGTNYCLQNYLAAIELLQKERKIELLNAKTMQTIRQPTPASVVKFRV